MTRTSRLILTTLIATISLTLAVGVSSARRIQLSPKQTFLLKWEPGTLGSQLLVFADGGGNRISCEVTLDGSFHSRTLAKVSGQLIGYVSNAMANEECNGTARMRMDTESLPWHVQYNSFAGTLPNPTSFTLTLVGFKFTLEVSGLGCTTSTTQANPFWMRAAVNAVHELTTIRVLEEHTIPLGGGFACSLVSPGHFAGTGIIDEGEPGTAKITIRLVQ